LQGTKAVQATANKKRLKIVFAKLNDLVVLLQEALSARQN